MQSPQVLIAEWQLLPLPLPPPLLLWLSGRQSPCMLGMLPMSAAASAAAAAAAAAGVPSAAPSGAMELSGELEQPMYHQSGLNPAVSCPAGVVGVPSLAAAAAAATLVSSCISSPGPMISSTPTVSSLSSSSVADLELVAPAGPEQHLAGLTLACSGQRQRQQRGGEHQLQLSALGLHEAAPAASVAAQQQWQWRHHNGPGQLQHTGRGRECERYVMCQRNTHRDGSSSSGGSSSSSRD